MDSYIKKKFNVSIKIIYSFIPVMILILLLGLIKNITLNHELNKGFNLTNIIKIYEKQDMLIQKISKDAYALYYSDDEKDVKYYLDDIKESVNSFEDNSYNIKNGIAEKEKLLKNSNKINEFIDKVQVNEKELLIAYRNIINMFENGYVSDVDFLENINVISKNENSYIKDMDEIVSLYEKDINEKVLFAENFEDILFHLTFLALILIVFFVILPAKKHLDKIFEDIKESREAAENFRNIAIKDNLTGLFNRYYFDLRAQDEIAISDRYDEPLTMMMLDLDHFKNINDTWGHPAGDEVLKKTAEILGSVIRKSDFVFRVGGEEFVVLMPKAEIGNAMAVAEKIRKAIENTEYNIAEKVTISIGVSQKQKSETLESWYSRTDKALYYAKESGRNCVVNFEEMNNNIFAFARIEWNNQWNCGHIDIDKQHKKIVELSNTLLFMSFSNNKSEKIMEQLNKIIDNVVNHFDFEEQLIAQIGYDNCDEHIMIHKSILEKTLKLKELYMKDELNETSFFSYVVDDVVIGHMVKEDVKFFEFMKKLNAENS